MNENDLKNLSIVFAIARKENSADRNAVIELLNLEDKIIAELKKVPKESDVKKVK